MVDSIVVTLKKTGLSCKGTSGERLINEKVGERREEGEEKSLDNPPPSAWLVFPPG